MTTTWTHTGIDVVQTQGPRSTNAVAEGAQTAPPHLSSLTTAQSVTFREATPEDCEHLAALYRDVYGGGYSIRECVDPSALRAALGSCIWVVACHGDRIVGAAASRPEPWNRSYEACRVATLEECRRRGVGAVLVDLSVETALRHHDCDLVYGTPRSARMRRLVEAAPHASRIVGSDLGMHSVGGEREVHLWSVAYPSSPGFLRVRNAGILAHRLPALRSFVEGIGLPSTVGPYPECAIVGPRSPLTHEHASSRLSYAFNASSRNILVTAASIGSSRTTQAAIWDLVDQRRGQVEHVSLCVLADKLELLSTLRSPYQADERRRFYNGAYLPAWYEEGGRRYDAVYLAACLDDRAPTMHGIEDAVAEFRDLFQD